MKRRVVITGIGPATSIGIGKQDFSAGIFGLKTCLAEIPRSYEQNYTFKSRYFVPKPKFSLTDLGFHKSVEGMMEEAARLSVLCTKLALEDAGFQISDGEKYRQVEGLENCGTIIGIGMSSLQTAFDSYIAHMADPEKSNKLRFNRMVIPMLMTNSPAAWISILFGLKGFSYTLNASCASGSYALGEAYRTISEGRCDVILTGGVEALAEKNGAIMRGFDMLSTLTRAEDGSPQPFSQQRSGFLFNEGAGCVLVLEELDQARSRGADIYAEIVGYEAGSDTYSIVQMDPSGDNIASLFEKIGKGVKVDYLNAHGTGTTTNDDIEAKVIQRIFGDKSNQPYINSTKGVLGHSIGASGALEAAVIALSIKESKIHGNLTTEPIDNLNLPLETLTTPIEYALSASYGFGGHNALILFKRYQENE
ncbi:beta-ketoacyl synthase [Desulfosporosinus sp. BICA1-9]|uniref:beta-ketoacyl-[acyl-carrier-protein] synthase family protein n=1 Tax=Desulfosporosinus sp. BICA1-9 TaxID=1531958 RepID=UPI00054BBFDE|nr:beta-ketoacyl-[acyl-carrier-protein] synthase family protein [Desulfosporosinus sp. BICA1-9]KJS77836.1 MAG: 3-oxoacyl-ACP synthase [Desulfosporosinus sp. BICA1-9]HBW38504.1 beta-ketoacyl-[acyl-carrier-protein] synthase family protein [Desulfosporosinus sp.]